MRGNKNDEGQWQQRQTVESGEGLGQVGTRKQLQHHELINTDDCAVMTKKPTVFV